MASIEFGWEWKPKTQTFVLVLYFHYEGETDKKANIRTEKCRGSDERPHVFSWAPLHTEQGMISWLLSLANIANGYKEKEKRALTRKLTKQRYTLNESDVYRVSKIIKSVRV